MESSYIERAVAPAGTRRVAESQYFLGIVGSLLRPGQARRKFGVLDLLEIWSLRFGICGFAALRCQLGHAAGDVLADERDFCSCGEGYETIQVVFDKRLDAVPNHQR